MTLEQLEVKKGQHRVLTEELNAILKEVRTMEKKLETDIQELNKATAGV
jgi:hypothetical protein